MNVLKQTLALVPSQQGPFLNALSVKRESVNDICDALDFLLAKSTELPKIEGIVDIVGTGGDGFNTLNISTTASFIVAASGANVAKHGGRAVSSQSGSADVLSALNIPFYQTAQQIQKALDTCHHVFLCAPLFNPYLQTLRDIRKSLKMPTLLNILGPLANPLRPRRLMVGVYRPDLLDKIAEVLRRQDAEHALVVHGDDGLDEISLSGPTTVYEIKQQTIRSFRIQPEDFGLSPAPIAAIKGGTPQQNAEMIQAILANTLQGPKRDIVLLNAAAGLYVAGKVPTLQAGFTLATELVVSGKALAALKNIQGEKA